MDEVLRLKSMHPYNYRHGEENPYIIGFELYKPHNLTPRPCFKVKYLSDNTIDHIPFESVVNGEWKFI